MESLFSVLPQRSPFRDELEHDADAVQELRLDGNLEDVSASLSWNVFYDFLNDRTRLLWLADGVFVAHDEDIEFLNFIPVASRFGFTCWMNICHVCIFVRRGLSPVPFCSALVDLRRNAEGADHVLISNDMTDTIDYVTAALPVTNEALVRLLGSNNVNKVQVFLFEFNEGQSRALATAAALGRLELRSCAIPDQFLEALHLNRSPRALLISSFFTPPVLNKSLFAAALRVNTSIKSLTYHIVGSEEGTITTDHEEVIESFAHNRAIMDLELFGNVNDDTTSLLSRALARNGTITSLNLSSLSKAGFRFISRESRTMRTRAVGDILEHNTLIQQITLPERDRIEDLYQRLVVPRLQLNQFRPQVRSVQEAPHDERGNTFLNACIQAGDNLSMVYLLLRENTDFMVEWVNA